MNVPEHSLLGKAAAYRGRYDPGLLFPMPRAAGRADIGVADPLPFSGFDVWNAYELSWLDPRGKPRIAVAEIRIPAHSPRLIESKSFKLYLNGFAGERLDADELAARLRRDLSAAAGADVVLELAAPDDLAGQPLAELHGESIDGLDVAIDDYGPPHADHLGADADAAPVHETLVSQLLKSNCPVTGQPDWASVQIDYAGAPLDRRGLLRYLVSFREHSGFHEQCVERIFIDISRRCAPARLSVYARYTRRGGLDINPFRSSDPSATPPNPRGPRQ